MTDPRRTAEDFEIVVDPETVVAAFRDRHEHSQHRNGRTVITVWPPFEGRSYAEHRFSRANSQWPSEMDVTPLDLSPEVFVDERAPTFPEETDRNWDDEWTAEVRAALRDEIDINEFAERPTEYVSVRYETE